MPGEPQQDDQSERAGLPADPTRPKKAGGNATSGWYALVGIGFEFLATICLLGAVGWYADRRLNTFPWLTIVGGTLGFAAGLMMMIRAAKNAFKD